MQTHIRKDTRLCKIQPLFYPTHSLQNVNMCVFLMNINFRKTDEKSQLSTFFHTLSLYVSIRFTVCVQSNGTMQMTNMTDVK